MSCQCFLDVGSDKFLLSACLRDSSECAVDCRHFAHKSRGTHFFSMKIPHWRVQRELGRLNHMFAVKQDLESMA